MTKKLARIIGILASAVSLLSIFAQTAFAQAASSSAGKGGTSSSLPSAGSTDLTYILFIGGVLLFVIGTLKLVLSFKDPS